MFQIHQFIEKYIKDDSMINSKLNNGTNILEGYSTVVQLGIQAPPGTMFILNASINSNTSSIIEIGDTGIFELDFKNNSTYISSLHMWVPEQLFDINTKTVREKFAVIIDILYEQ